MVAMRKVGGGGGGVVSNRGRWAIFFPLFLCFSFLFCISFSFFSYTLLCFLFSSLVPFSRQSSLVSFCPPLFLSLIFFFFSFFPSYLSLSLLSFFFCFFSLVCSFRAVFIGAAGAGLTLSLSYHCAWGVRPSCPIMVPGEVANEGVACRARLLDFHHPLVFHHKEVWVALGFDSVCASGGGAKWEETKGKKKKGLSSPVACPGEEEEEQCRIKWHCFIFIYLFAFSHFFMWGPKNG